MAPKRLGAVERAEPHREQKSFGAPSSGPSVVTVLYTHCQDSCPVTASTIRGALDQLGHDVPVYAVSVDPANDTPNSARVFMSQNHVTGRMHFLLSPDATLQHVWTQFGIRPQERDSAARQDAFQP